MIEPIESFRVTLEADGLVTSAGAKQGLAVLEYLPRGATCEFAVRADGFAPCYGELAIDGATTAESARRFDLHKGWGTDVTVVDTADRPIAGARVNFDGQFAALTDARGRARIALDHEPQAVRVEHPGWRLAPGTSIAPDTGRFRTWEPFLRVILERDDVTRRMPQSRRRRLAPEGPRQTIRTAGRGDRAAHAPLLDVDDRDSIGGDERHECVQRIRLDHDAARHRRAGVEAGRSLGRERIELREGDARRDGARLRVDQREITARRARNRHETRRFCAPRGGIGKRRSR
jgi:hypothetical protein